MPLRLPFSEKGTIISCLDLTPRPLPLTAVLWSGAPRLVHLPIVIVIGRPLLSNRRPHSRISLSTVCAHLSV